MRRIVHALGLTALCALSACATDTADSEEAYATGLRDLYRDGKNLDLSDLLSVTAGFATEELNDALDVTPFAQIELEPTELYALSHVAQDDLTLKDLDALVTGLAHRFGERELTTEVNRARRDHLATSADVVFAESAFEIGAGLHDWSHGTEGFDDVSVRLGFDANERVEARIIAAYASEQEALYQAPLAAVKATRGFVLPRGAADLAAMKPGESYALAGRGRLGVNLGVGVPILTTALDAVTYNLVFSAGVRTLLDGRLDVQVVRLEGDQIVIDVGMKAAETDELRVALHDGWGVQGLIESEVQIGPIDLDLGRLAERALEKQLNKKLDLVHASYEQTGVESRISVSRFRYDLSAVAAGSAAELSIAQLLHGDLRLAQALANRAEPGVRAEFELSRSGISSTSYAGIDLLGMSFFRKVQEQSGTVVVQTPGGAQAINFDSLHESGGKLFSSHGYTRVGLAGLAFDAADPEGARGEANLVFQILEGADLMDRDTLLDHLDGIIIGIGGPWAFIGIEAPGNELERFVESYCPNSDAFDPCREAVLETPQVAELKQKGLDALAAEIGHLGEAQRALVMKAGEMRLIAQSTYEPKAQWKGPPSSVVVDYRLDDGALDHVLAATESQFDLAMDLVLRTMHVDRGDTLLEIGEDAQKVSDQTRSLRGAAWTRFAAAASRYRHIQEAEGLVLDGHPELGEMGDSAIEIRFPVSHGDNVKYEEAVVRSLPQARASAVTGLVDELIDLVDDAKGLDHAEQIVAYTLLGLTPGRRVDLRLDVDMDLSNNWAQAYDHYVKAGYGDVDVYARGSDVAPIDGGLFDVDQLIEVD